MRVMITLFLLLMLSTVTFSGGFVQGTTTCPSSGNKQISSTSYYLYQLSVIAPSANAGTVYIGGNTVSTSSGPGLAAGAAYNVGNRNSPDVNPSALYFACSNSSDTIQWIGAQ